MAIQVFHSFVIAQIMGLYLIVISIILLSRIQYYRELVAGLKCPNMALMASASFWLLIGIILVDLHNFWEWKPRVIVTIVAWMVLIKSVLWLAMPKRMLAFTQRAVAGPWLYVSISISTILGILLLTKGYLVLSMIDRVVA